MNRAPWRGRIAALLAAVMAVLALAPSALAAPARAATAPEADAPAAARPPAAERATTAADPESLPVAAEDASPTSISGGAGDAILRLGIGLVVVVGLIGAVWFVLKRVRRAKHPELEARGDLIDVVATTQLGPNRTLHVVRVGEELVVLGATEHAITPVARLSGEEALAAWSPDHGAHDARPGHVPPSSRQGFDARARASATSRDATVLERLRALTVRR